jgi:hypothetical protein
MTNDKNSARQRSIAHHIEKGREHLERSKAKRESTRMHLDAARREIERLKRAYAR